MESIASLSTSLLFPLRGALVGRTSGFQLEKSCDFQSPRLRMTEGECGRVDVKLNYASIVSSSGETENPAPWFS